jgi:hypothetical protein
MTWPPPEGSVYSVLGIGLTESRPHYKLVICGKCGGMRIDGGHHAARIVARDDGFVHVDCVGDLIAATPVPT